MTNIVALETSSDLQTINPVSDLPLEMLALVGGGDGAVVPF